MGPEKLQTFSLGSVVGTVCGFGNLEICRSFLLNQSPEAVSQHSCNSCVFYLCHSVFVSRPLTFWQVFFAIFFNISWRFSVQCS
jgi:hypothetical protein